MKNFLIYASAIGLVAGVIYWLYKKDKTNNINSTPTDNEADLNSKQHNAEPDQMENVVEEMYQSKDVNAQSVHERHTAAKEIIRDSYSNIMEDFVEDFSDESVTEDKIKEIVIDDKYDSITKKLDSLSDELDNL